MHLQITRWSESVHGEIFLPSPQLSFNSCVAITGLGGHVYGSWQDKSNKDFMWIRDYLPRELPSIRVILFGYDTTLKGSHSFKMPDDIANHLISQLVTGGWGEPSAKPIVFLAHSLGGIIFKQAIVMLANSPAVNDMLRLLKGAVLLGVPNFGMDQAHLEEVVRYQPNRGLVEYLRSDCDTLLRMDEAFANLAASRNMDFLWGYETLDSPATFVRREASSRCAALTGSTQTVAGKLDVDGPRRKLVTPQSATRSLCDDPRASRSVFAIDETHSDMAKFGDGSLYSTRVVDFMSKISLPTAPCGSLYSTRVVDFIPKISLPVSPCESRPSSKLPALGGRGTDATQGQTTGRATASASHYRSETTVELNAQGMLPLDMLLVWARIADRGQDVANSLGAPDLSDREGRIQPQYQYTFGWVFENEEFNKWLNAETGLFWFKGKPGCGKSVMMRFLLRDPRTRERLHNLLGGPYVCLGFFFWHGGSLLQQSREGLLRSILSELLQNAPR